MCGAAGSRATLDVIEATAVRMHQSGECEKGERRNPVLWAGRRYYIRLGSPCGLRRGRVARRAGVPVELSASKTSPSDS